MVHIIMTCQTLTAIQKLMGSAGSIPSDTNISFATLNGTPGLTYTMYMFDGCTLSSN